MAGVVTSLVAARLRHAPPRRLIVMAGIAAATLVPVVVSGAAAVTANAALTRAVSSLPISARSITVTVGGPLEDARAARTDTQVRQGLAELGGGSVRSELLYRELVDQHGGTFVLAATDRLPSAVRLLSGRLPGSCTPVRCEVVDVFPTAADAARQPADPAERTSALAALGLVVVGRVERTDPLLLSGGFDPSSASSGNDVDPSAGTSSQGVRLLLSGDVRKAAAITPLIGYQRSFGWVQALDVSRVRRLGVDAWVTLTARVADHFSEVLPPMSISAPDTALRDEQARAVDSARRFALLGGTAAVLLLGTAVTGGAAMRRDHAAFLGSLSRRGAGRGQRAGVVAGEVVTTVLVAGLAGLLAGTAAVAGLAAGAGMPVGRTAVDGLVAALPAAGLLLAGCAALLAAALCWTPGGQAAVAGGRAGWAVPAGAGLGCLLVAGLLASRGGVGANGGTDPLLPALPALLLTAAALLAAAGWPALAGLARDRLPRTAVGARLGLSAVAGRPLRAVTTAALVTAAVGASVFAGGYRATLQRGALDQAAFAVPLDAKVTTGAALRSPLELAAPADYAPGGTAYPVLRQAGSVRTGPQQADAVGVLGVQASMLPRIARWSATTGNQDPEATARLLGQAINAGGTLRLGVPLPAGGRVLTIQAPGFTDVGLELFGWVRSTDGRERAVPLTEPSIGPAAQGSSNGRLIGPLPDLAGPTYLAAIQVRQDPYLATRRQHAIGEARRALPAQSGRLRLGAVSVDGRPVPNVWTGWAGSGLTIGPQGSSATFDYRLDGQAEVLDAAPGGPGSGSTPLPVLTDPITARAGRAGLTLVLGGLSVPATVVGTLPRFPTAPPRFAVSDLSILGHLADRTTPGTGQADELWLSLPPGGQIAADPGLTVVRQADVALALRTDPVARGAVLLLLGGAGLTLLIALIALVLLVVTERQDDAGELYAWEADGVPPGALRAGLWWRAVAVAAVGVPAGVLAGLLLARLTARLVAVTAGATTPQPPLVAGAGVGSAILAVGAGLVLALLAAGVVAAGSLREPLPVPTRGAP